MTFEEIVDQAMAMLQRRGRVAYRTLKRQFNLDDEALEDLKAELIDAQRLAADEDGKVLVWTGGTASPPTLATAPERAPHTYMPPYLAEKILTFRSALEGERKQLTMLFCDLVDSTVLASQLDPEEWRAVVRAYQDTCAKVIQRFEGHIAQYLGDGLLVYFGYPVAHEDDAQRAVRAGLGMVDAMGQLNARRAQERGVAAPNTVVISATTLQLLGGFFACQALGTHLLKGVAQPLAVYQILYESTARSRLEAAGRTGLTPLVGREQEIRLLLERWAQVTEGVGQVVLLSGEAGIGKSRLVQVLLVELVPPPKSLSQRAQRVALCRALGLHRTTADEVNLDKLFTNLDGLALLTVPLLPEPQEDWTMALARTSLVQHAGAQQASQEKWRNSVRQRI